MTSLQVAEKKEKSLGEILIVVVVVALLMMTFIFYFFKHQNQFTQTGFNSLANVFSARVNGIRAQWFMEKQPKFVMADSNNVIDGGKLKIYVNENGWVDFPETSLKCQHIWQRVLETPLIYMNEPISAVLINAKSNKFSQICQYTLSSGVFFAYKMSNGNVSDVQTHH